MSLKKRGTSYTSFEYLEPGDFEAFELAAEIDRVPPAPVELTAEREERYRRLLEEIVMVSLHEHLNLFPADITRTPEYVRTGRTARAGSRGSPRSRARR